MHFNHALRIFFCYVNLGLREEAVKFYKERFKVRDDKATLEKLVIAIFDWKQTKTKTEEVTYATFENSLETSAPGSTSRR